MYKQVVRDLLTKSRFHDFYCVAFSNPPATAALEAYAEAQAIAFYAAFISMEPHGKPMTSS